MSDDGVIGIALYYRTALERIVGHILPRILAFWPYQQTLEIFSGQTRFSSLQRLADINMRHVEQAGRRGMWSIRHEDISLLPSITFIDPETIEAPFSKGIFITMHAQHFDYDAFLAMCADTLVSYAFVTRESSVEAVYDEIAWPMKPLAAQDSRGHSNAWLRLMRSFAKSSLGSQLPDLYAINILGRHVMQEIRDRVSLDKLESYDEIRWLEGGHCVLAFDENGCHYSALNDAQAYPNYAEIADLISPLFLIQQPLQQAQQGNALILEDLVRSRDQRLLLGLAFNEGLAAFSSLLSQRVSHAPIESVATALAYLEQTRGQRPRCYGEPLWEDEDIQTDEITTENSDPKGSAEVLSSHEADGSISDSLGEVDEENGGRVKAADSSLTWELLTTQYDALRLQRAALGWRIHDVGVPGQQYMEIVLENTVARPMRIHQMRWVKLNSERCVGIENIVAPVETIAPGAVIEPHEYMLLSAENNGDLMHLEAQFSYDIDVNILDFMIQSSGIRIIGANAQRDAVLSTWPVLVNHECCGDELCFRLVNTTQQPWLGWSVELVDVREPEEVLCRDTAAVACLPAEPFFARIPLTQLKVSMVYRVLLRSNIHANLTLATLKACD